MSQLKTSNNAIIESRTAELIQKLLSSKKALGIKHNRNKQAAKQGKSFRREDGEIKQVGIIMSKGDIMTHKGKGRFPDNRVAKPWFNPIAEQWTEELADDIAANTGDVIAGHILID